MKKKLENKKREKKPVRLYWDVWVKMFFKFYKENFFGRKPSFDGSAPRDMGMIYDAIKKNADEKGIAWTEEISKRSWLVFLKMCNNDGWLHDHYILSNLNRQKDRIFIAIKSLQNGKDNKGSDQQVTTQCEGNVTERSFGEL